MKPNNGRYNILLSAYACEPNKGSEPGVGWNWAVNLAQHHNVYIITRSNNRRVIEDFLKVNRLNNITFFYYDCKRYAKLLKKTIPFGIFLYYKKWQREVVPLAKEVVEKYSIDIIHHITFNEFRTPGQLCSIGIPFVWGPVGGGQFYNPVMKNAYFRKLDIVFENIRNFINRRSLKSSKFKNVTDNANVVLIADKSTEYLMPKQHNYIRMLETAVDPSQFDVLCQKSESDELRILWVGAIIPRKGLKWVIEALGESGYRAFHLIVVGDGRDRSRCESLVSKYGLSTNIKFVGRVNYNVVSRYYKEADIFLFSSLRDTSGNVVLEAMAHNLPVIALNQHGVSDIVTKETGDLINVVNYKQVKADFVNLLIFYTKNRSNLKDKGVNAKRRIEELFTWKKKMSQILPIYDNILLKQ